MHSPKIRQPHHNFTEAVRHPEPASNLERYGGAEEAEDPPKQNSCTILSVCVYVCVCGADVWTKSDSVQT